MAQLAMPYRIVLVAILVLAAGWVTVLRPRPADERASGPPSTASAPRSAPAPRAQPRPAPALPAASAGAPGSAPAPKEDVAAPILRALDGGRAAVLLFSSGRGSVDAAVRAAVARVDRRGGQVLVRRIGMGELGRYESITRGVLVSSSPTVVVAGPARRAHAIQGLTTHREVAQAVGDALDTEGDVLARARVGRGHALRLAARSCRSAACRAYFSGANDACVRAAGGLTTPPADSPSLAVLQALRTKAGTYADAVDGVAVPAGQARAHRRATGILRGEFGRLDRALAGAKQPARTLARVRRDPAGRRADEALRRLGFAACA